MTRLELQYLAADVLGLPPWARTTLATRPTPPSLPGMIVPSSLDEVPELQRSFDEEARAELTAGLADALAAFEPHVQVLESVRALREPGTAMVIAGQQPGFLGGPLFDVYKAMTAIRLARALSELWKRPVVPAFWNHADDHDIAEVHHLWIQNPNLDLRKVSLAGVSSGRVPFSNIRFDAERSRLAAIEELVAQNLAPAPHLEDALGLFLPRDGESFSNAFSRVMLRLFGASGLVVVEPDWIREPLSRSLAEIVVAELADALRTGGEVLQRAGSERVIDPDGAALVFHHEDGKRAALRLAGSDLRYDGEAGSRTAAELAAEIVQDPGAWSAGALLRPLAQDRTLPVVAYVGGWGELAYHAQLPTLRKRAGVPTTAFVPRLSATLVEPSASASLAKLGAGVEEVLRAKGHFGRDAEAPAAEAPAAAKLRSIARAARDELLDQREALSKVDRGLAQQLRKVAGQVHDSVEKLAAKADRVASNTKGGSRRHHRRLNNALFPRELPQERVHGLLPFAARYGTDWIETLQDEIDPLPTEHLVVHLQPSPSEAAP